MSHPAQPILPLTQRAARLAPSAWLLLPAGASFVLAGSLMPDPVPGLVLLSIGATLATLGLLLRWFAYREARARDRLHENIAEFVALDAAPSFTTDADGQIGYQNRAASTRFGDRCGDTLVRALRDQFANPAAVLYRLQARAAAVGAAREDVVTRAGHMRLAVHQIGDKGFLWRMEEMADRSAGGRGAEALSLPMLTASRNGTILFMNEALRRLLGGRVRRLDQVFVQLPLRSGEEAEVRGADGPLRTIVAELESSSGRCEIYLLPVAHGGVVTPVDETGFEELPVALVRLAPDGGLVAANRLARELLEIAPGEPAQFADLIEGLGRPVSDWLADAMAGRALNRPEVLLATRPSRETYLRIVLRRDRVDGSEGLVAVLTDATELKTLEAQFVQSQKMQAIGQLAGGVAHDFNNLLTAIAGHCDLLLLRHDRGDPDYADLEQIHHNTNRAAALVGQLLAFSRKQTLKPQVIDMRDTLGELTHLLNRLVGERISLVLSIDPDLPPIRADRRQLEQVVMNLIVNARDAMADGGEIAIEVRQVMLDRAMRRDRAVVAPGSYVVITVRDQGRGIPPEHIGKVFEPFFTTKRTGEGTGLGLSTAYGIVKQTGGFIFVDSTPGEGSVFSLYFAALDPVEAEQAAGAPEVPEQAGNGRGDGVILLVEDEAPVRAFASRALRMHGYTVLEADNAEDALDTLRDPALKVDLFVTDVIMPGMDGPSWVREARKARPDVKVVFVSGYAEESFSETQARIPNSVFLPKPFSLNELTATVHAQIH